jgi:anti-sigma factor RsiW
MTNRCSFSRWTESYLDGELSPEHTVDFENHLSACPCCTTKLKFDRAVRLSTQRAIRGNSQPSSAFEAKLRAVMMAERVREQTEAVQGVASQRTATSTPFAVVSADSSANEPAHRPLSWRAIAPISIAAAAALAFAALRGEPTLGSGQVLASNSGSELSRTDTMQTVREFLDQLAEDSEHNSRNDDWRTPYRLPLSLPLVADSINVVHGQRLTPPRLENAGAFWEGYHLRQVPVQGRVSSWHYRVANHRVLLWVYDSKKLPLRAVLEPRVAHNQPVFVGTHRGRAVAALEKNGFGYAATTDLPQTQAAELVASLGNDVSLR